MEQGVKTKEEVAQQLRAQSRSKHKPGRKHELSNADYIVTKSGAWVRLTERNVSRSIHNNHCRRRLAKGK